MKIPPTNVYPEWSEEDDSEDRNYLKGEIPEIDEDKCEPIFTQLTPSIIEFIGTLDILSLDIPPRNILYEIIRPLMLQIIKEETFQKDSNTFEYIHIDERGRLERVFSRVSETLRRTFGLLRKDTSLIKKSQSEVES